MVTDDPTTPSPTDSLDECLALLGKNRVMDADFMLRRLGASESDQPRGRILECQIAIARQDQPRAYLACKKLGPSDQLPPPVRLSLAQAAFTVGRLDEAEAAIDTLPLDTGPAIKAGILDWRLRILIAARRLDRAEAVLDMVESKPIFRSISTIRRAEIALKREDPTTAREILATIPTDDTTPAPIRFESAFLMARAYEQLGDADAAFKAAERGNRVHDVAFDDSAHRAKTEDLINRSHRSTLSTQPRSSTLAEAPTFIVGMPRSGTSLIEQIIASHPEASGVGEQQTPFRLIEDLTWVRDRPTAEQSIPGVLDDSAQRYLRMHLACGVDSKRVTNKALGLERILGDLVSILPRARFVFIDRDPRDLLLSIHQNPLNVRHYPWSTRLEDAANAIDSFRRLVDHWVDVLPNPCHRVRYEALVDEQEAETTRLLTFLDLPPDPRCLAFEKTPRVVLTPSADQLMRGLNRDGIGRWERYRAHLGQWASADNPQ